MEAGKKENNKTEQDELIIFYFSQKMAENLTIFLSFSKQLIQNKINNKVQRAHGGFISYNAVKRILGDTVVITIIGTIIFFVFLLFFQCSSLQKQGKAEGNCVKANP